MRNLWLPMPRDGKGWRITPDELRAWTLFEDADVLVVNKPAHVVCHPAKDGPWTALGAACREYLGVARAHMPVRLDRETSGVVLVAKHAAAASKFHNAVTRGHFEKRYLAILTGELESQLDVDAPLGREPGAEYTTRQIVIDGGRKARTTFEPLLTGGGFTLAAVTPHTGRMHQIRVHAAHAGHAIVGDKLYGPDSSLMLRFIHEGFTAEHRALLLIDRQALHAARLEFPFGAWEAPLPEDLRAFCRERMGVDYSDAWTAAPTIAMSSPPGTTSNA